MTPELADIEERLRRRGHRITRAGKDILRFVIRHPGHFDAESLRADLRARGSAVSRATVYRTLARLVEAGVLRRHVMGERRARYEPRLWKEHHEHLICVRCGRIIEFVEPRIERLQQEACRRHDFRALRHTLNIHGVCGACRRAEERPSSHVEDAPPFGVPARGA